MFLRLDRKFNQKLAQVEADIKQETIEELRRIATGEATMTPAMKELLKLAPDLNILWQQFEARKSSRTSAIDGTVITNVSTRNMPKKLE